MCQAAGLTVCTADGSTIECDAAAGLPSDELCDGLDNDCDGELDEEFPGLGDACDEGVGACQAAGQRVCAADGLGSECDAEPGEPDAEACDGVDNDCDGDVDEDFADLGGACSEGIGQCAAAGELVCSADGSDVECDAEPGAPGAERCDGLDNDCDGDVDEDFGDLGAECTSGAGACTAAGHMICAADGLGTTCDAAVGPEQPEVCDGVDNDCDGDVDEGFVLGDACTVGVGECVAAGVTACAADGAGTTCDATAGPPAAEACDGLDNDCDGDVDEDFLLGAACTSGQGACAADGVTVCSADGVGTACSAAEGVPGAELCDGVDNDCDGDVDEDFPGLGAACTAGEGTCAADGVLVCSADGTTATCDAPVGEPADELCDGLDNDCDGALDEDFVELGQPCFVGLGACRSEGVTVCAADATATECDADAGTPGDEICDDIDNDCDGSIDEGCDDDGWPWPNELSLAEAYNRTYGTDYDTQSYSGLEQLVDEHSLPMQATWDISVLSQCQVLVFDTSATHHLYLRLHTGGGDEMVELYDPGPWTPDSRGWLPDHGSLEVDLGLLIEGAGYDPMTPFSFGLGNNISLGDTNTYLLEGLTDGEFMFGYNDGGLVAGDADANEPAMLCFAPPAFESCNGVDDDGDGAVDEGFAGLGDACSAGVGACAAAGTMVCSADGQSVECSAVALPPTPELCDGQDNDCDGDIDEDFAAALGQPCAAGVGECLAQGTVQCAADGAGTVCDATPGDPQPEACDGLDNDCDGEVDETCYCPAAPVFTGGEDNTTANGAPATHTWDTHPRWTAHIDGATWLWDEFLVSDPHNDVTVVFERRFELPAGARNVRGTLTIAADNSYSCTLNGDGPFASAIETNYFMEDMGLYDLTPSLQEGVNLLVCAVTNWAQPGGNAYTNPAGLLYRLDIELDNYESVEVCDGLDNDCDGLVDEDLGVLSCGTGACEHTVDACVGGVPQVCDPLAGAEPELCDGLDNDCDGDIDEDLGQVTCGLGACEHSVDACAGGQPTVCDPLEGAAPELRDGLDNDCDGEIDEDFQAPFCADLDQPVTYVDAPPAAACGGLVLQPGQLLLLDSACAPLAGVRAFLLDEEGRRLLRVDTDVAGVADFTAYAGARVPDRFQVYHQRGVAETAAGSFTTGASVQTQRQQLTLLGYECTPLPNVRVVLFDGEDRWCGASNTDEQGVAGFELLPGVQRRLQVRYRGGQWTSALNAASVHTVLGTEGFAVEVQDNTGAAFPGVRAVLTDEASRWRGRVDTGADGVATIDVLPQVPYRFQLRLAGGTLDTEVSITHELQQVQTRELALLLRDSTGAPIDNAGARLIDAAGARRGWARTDADGLAGFQVLPGLTYGVQVAYRGAEFDEGPVEMLSDTLLDVTTLPFELLVLDPNGAPRAGVGVRLLRADGSGAGWARTGDDGLAHFEVLPEAELQLEARYRGGSSASALTVVTQPTTLSLQLVTLTGRFQAAGAPLYRLAVDLLQADSDQRAQRLRTNVDGEVVFELLPGSAQGLSATWGAQTWLSGPTVGPAVLEHTFQ